MERALQHVEPQVYNLYLRPTILLQDKKLQFVLGAQKLRELVQVAGSQFKNSQLMKLSDIGPGFGDQRQVVMRETKDGYMSMVYDRFDLQRSRKDISRQVQVRQLGQVHKPKWN